MFYEKPVLVLYEKGVLKNLAKFTQKHLRQSLFFDKVTGVLPKILSTCS